MKQNNRCEYLHYLFLTRDPGLPGGIDSWKNLMFAHRLQMDFP